MITWSRVLLVGLLTLTVLAGCAGVQGPYPDRPITLVVPFPQHGVSDIVAQGLALPLERTLKQSVRISHKPGAAGAVGTAWAARAKPDGYTLLIGLVFISVIPEVDQVFARSPVFTRDDFVGIARLTAEPPVMVVEARAPWKDVKDLVAEAKKHPDRLTFVSSGPYGTLSHLPMEMFLHAAGVRMRHQPIADPRLLMPALVDGHAAALATLPTIAAPSLREGKIRALATWGSARLANFPDVPTMKELGYDIEYYNWSAVFVPKGVPSNVVKTLREAIRQAVHDAEFRVLMEKYQMPIAYQDTDEFGEWWDRDARILADLIKRIGKVEAK